jgi:DNA repair protein RadC
MVLKDIPADARPREKLLASGASALADAELIALLLRTGLKGTSVLQLAQQLLDHFGGMQGLLHAQASDLKRIKGLGPAKRAEIAAVVEIARRALQQEFAHRPVFDAPATVKSYLRLQLGGRGFEVFVYPREVVKRALDLHAGAVILAHNHPSGAAEPSRADEYLTQTLKSALQLVDVRVLDHMVIGQSDVVSMAERGLL